MLRSRFALMGLPVDLGADDEALLRAALDAYGAEMALPAETGAAAVEIELYVADPSGDEGPFEIRVDGARLELAGAGVRGAADADRRAARCVIPRSLLADPARLANDVLDTLLLFIATRAGRVPVHASAFIVGQAAAVLAGPSGTGKSTLALAARRAGLPVLSDDTIYVQLDPIARLWALPRPIHVYPRDAGDEGEGEMRLRSGRWKRAIAVSADAPRSADRAALFLLERGTRVSLRPADPETAVERMMAMLEPGFDHFRDHLPDVVRALAANGAWTLTLSADPAEAVAIIRETLSASS